MFCGLGFNRISRPAPSFPTRDLLQYVTITLLQRMCDLGGLSRSPFCEEVP